MCGIAGILDLHGRREPDRAALERMTERITHRGPDEDGYLFDSRLPGMGIGMRRLSIVGLADGQQPIFNCDPERRGDQGRQGVSVEDNGGAVVDVSQVKSPCSGFASGIFESSRIRRCPGEDLSSRIN